MRTFKSLKLSSSLSFEITSFILYRAVFVEITERHDWVSIARKVRNLQVSGNVGNLLTHFQSKLHSYGIQSIDLHFRFVY